jgi:hypothetical protein
MLERADLAVRLLSELLGHPGLRRWMLEQPGRHYRLEPEASKRASAWQQRLGSRSHLQVLLEYWMKAHVHSSSGNVVSSVWLATCATSTNPAPTMALPAKLSRALGQRV